MADIYIPAEGSDTSSNYEGTNGDDNFIFSEDDHGTKEINNGISNTGGSDTYYLALDVDAKNKIPHPYRLHGGGRPEIWNIDLNDKLILPKGADAKDLFIKDFGYNRSRTFSSFEIFYSPHQYFEKLGPAGYAASLTFYYGDIFVDGSAGSSIGAKRSDGSIIYDTGHPIAVNGANVRATNPAALEEYNKAISPYFGQFNGSETDSIARVRGFPSIELSDIVSIIYNSDGSKAFNSDGTIRTGIATNKKIYSGNSHDYTFINQGNNKYGIKADNSTKIDSITGISEVEFTDKSIDIDKDVIGVFDQVTGLNTDSGKMFRLYNAAFARFPDADGLNYWIGNFSSGIDDERAVSSSFLASSEFKERYGDNITHETYVQNLYLNVLNRELDQGGYDYWVGNLNNGIEQRHEVLLGFSESAENKALFTEMTGLA